MDSSTHNSCGASPFLKWAGGKRWFVNSHLLHFPGQYKTYIEPFLGSGAVFFSLNPQKAILSDLNGDLISTYRTIADDYVSVLRHLRKHHRLHSDAYYYKIRAQKFVSQTAKAAQFIYLNRTCWNGLYRVNLKGEFNVPKGTKTKVLMEHDDFESIAVTLKRTKLVCQDFEKTINLAKQDDLVFADPPYTVNHNLNGFIKYNEKIFSWDDQIRLCAALERAVARGVQVVMTNANHASIRDLYRANWHLDILPRATVLSGSIKGRTATEELLVKSFV